MIIIEERIVNREFGGDCFIWKKIKKARFPGKSLESSFSTSIIRIANGKIARPTWSMNGFERLDESVKPVF